MKNTIIVLFIASLLFSCNTDNKEREIIINSRDLKIENIKKQNDIKYNFNDLHYKFSYQFNAIIKENKQIVEYYDIIDVYTKDNKNYVKIDTYYHHLDLLVTDETILNELMNNHDEVENELLIIKLEEIRKFPYIIEINETDNYLEIVENNNFIGKGRVLELIKI